MAIVFFLGLLEREVLKAKVEIKRIPEQSNVFLQYIILMSWEPLQA